MCICCISRVDCGLLTPCTSHCGKCTAENIGMRLKKARDERIVRACSYVLYVLGTMYIRLFRRTVGTKILSLKHEQSKELCRASKILIYISRWIQYKRKREKFISLQEDAEPAGKGPEDQRLLLRKIFGGAGRVGAARDDRSEMRKTEA
ncbi:hypothetical protein ALC62_07737 [Cyphomyrmex costatus]|uniref:Uncharacterized protein n=1 Tax=Cyphomyrmex costatus TaxID=456900 RepID=A0A195CLG4_9HYME|nr:hypothetical protein ALC62_07737 [Cyphomyrmex costatus]